MTQSTFYKLNQLSLATSIKHVLSTARAPHGLIQSEGVMHQSTLQCYMNWERKKLMN